VLAIAVAALGLRAVYVLLRAPSQLPLGDGVYFHQLANDLVAGWGYVDPIALFVGDQHPSASHPPLFPTALAAVSFVGGKTVRAHQLTESVFDALAVLTIAWLGREVAGRRVGLIAGGLAAVYPRLWMNEGQVYSESLYGLTIALMLLVAYRFWSAPSLRTGIEMGFAVGVAALCRAEALLYLPLLALPLALLVPRMTRRRRAGIAAVALGGTLVAVGPWTAVNLTRFEKPILISSSTGLLIAGANCDATYHGKYLGAWKTECTFRPSGDESEQSDTLRRVGTDYAREHLGRLPVVVAAREGRAFDVFDTRSTEWTGRSWTGRALLYSWYALVPMAIAGGVMLHRRGGVPVFPLVVPVLAVVIAVAVTWGSPRFRVPVDIGFLVLAAVAVSSVCQTRRTRGGSVSVFLRMRARNAA
jgi:4-amino-4-deoxy-L-arabinose transferase-like glycosyltransferase